MSTSPTPLTLVGRLLQECGGELHGRQTVHRLWLLAGIDEAARREVLLTQIATFRVRRGVVGRYLDHERVLLEWRPADAPTTTGREPEADLAS